MNNYTKANTKAHTVEDRCMQYCIWAQQRDLDANKEKVFDLAHAVVFFLRLYIAKEVHSFVVDAEPVCALTINETLLHIHAEINAFYK